MISTKTKKSLKEKQQNYIAETCTISPLTHRHATSGKIDSRKKVVSDMWSLLCIKDAQLLQRSKVKWLKGGDANTSFFHVCIMSRSIKNTILTLKVRDAWVEEFSEIQQEVVNHFSIHFIEPLFYRSRLDGVSSILYQRGITLVLPLISSSLRLIGMLVCVMEIRV